ncbi:MAG TPA: hypothetical protein VMY37_38330 [Thermoguttaceae bacterium]|nr:hypothetical protein [Thermoguttaceae bacterium]
MHRLIDRAHSPLAQLLQQDVVPKPLQLPTNDGSRCRLGCGLVIVFAHQGVDQGDNELILLALARLLRRPGAKRLDQAVRLNVEKREGATACGTTLQVRGNPLDGRGWQSAATERG